MMIDCFPRDSAKISIERLLLEDEDSYVGFLMAAYKDHFNACRYSDRNMVSRFWRWEYLENPRLYGDRPYIWLCRLSGRIIAQICVMPVTLKAGADHLRAGWCQDFMVLEEFRNMGLSLILLRRLQEGLKDSFDILMAAGTNENSYPILKAAGFIDMGMIGRNVIPVNCLKIGLALCGITGSAGVRHAGPDKAAGLISPGKGGLEIYRPESFAEEFDAFFTAVARQYPYITVRDKAILKWRFLDNPLWHYDIFAVRRGREMKGYMIVREGRFNCPKLAGLRVAIISDALFDKEDRRAGKALYDSVCEYFRPRADAIRFDLLGKDTRRRLGSRRGLLGVRSANRFMIYPLSANIGGLPGTKIRDRDNWYLTFCDSDLDFS